MFADDMPSTKKNAPAPASLLRWRRPRPVGGGTGRRVGRADRSLPLLPEGALRNARWHAQEVLRQVATSARRRRMAPGARERSIYAIAPGPSPGQVENRTGARGSVSKRGCEPVVFSLPRRATAPRETSALFAQVLELRGEPAGCSGGVARRGPSPRYHTRSRRNLPLGRLGSQRVGGRRLNERADRVRTDQRLSLIHI